MKYEKFLCLLLVAATHSGTHGIVRVFTFSIVHCISVTRAQRPLHWKLVLYLIINTV